MSRRSVLRRSRVLLVATLAACSARTFDATITRPPGVMPGPATHADSVEELPRPEFGPGWQEGVTAMVGGPYEILASIHARSAGSRALALGRERLRLETAALGGDAMLVTDVTRENVGPYTRTSGLALRRLPPMPDALARCAALDGPDAAAARVVACREAARQDRSRTAAWSGLALAHLSLAFGPASGLQKDGAVWNASRAMERAASADPAWAAAAPWLDAVRPLFGGDSLRTALVVADRLDQAGLADGAIAAAREAVRLAPRDPTATIAAADLLRTAGRLAESMAVAAEFARLEPDRVEGWVLAGIAAHRAGDFVLAMRAFARVATIEPRYFSRWTMMTPRGAAEEAAARRRVGAQPPATVEDLRL